MRGTSPLLGFLGSSSLAILAGCTTSVEPAAGEPAAEVSTTATAVVVVEGSTTSDGTSARTEAVARFVRARSGAVDDEALRMVGAAVDFPAMQSCGAISSTRASASRALSLLDVGGVTLFAGDGVAALQPRQLPDVADLVSGVVYSARAEALPSKSDYLLRVDGAPGSDVPAFAVSATSPGEPDDVRIGGDDGRAGAAWVALGGPTELTWEPGNGDDVIYVDLAATAAAPSTRCLFDDVGRATLPATAFGAIADGTVAVHRLHRESFRAHGVDPGEVRFDFARVVSFARR
jgi:hypothetical protein